MAADAAGLDVQVLAAVHAATEPLSTLTLADTLGVTHQKLVGVVKSLGSDEYLSTEPKSRTVQLLTPAGAEAVKEGSPEARVFAGVPEGEGATIAAVQEALGAAVYTAGFGPAMRLKWLRKDGANLVRVLEAVTDTVKEQLEAVSSDAGVDAKTMKLLSKRKLAKEETTKYFMLGQGPNFALERKKPVAELTREMIETGDWSTTKFKALNFASLGADAGGGHLHVLLKVRAEFRAILLEMGFGEMPTARFVESSFWNFDSLFQPQSHPARDAHDTFFVTHPANALSVPEGYLAKVQKMHEEGGAGSIGYRYHWQRSEAMKNLLRTHTTAVSARMLHALANQPGGFKPTRLFSIDRVFRNETLDATHLAEFHQVEGVVADYDLSLGDLIGVVREFFNRIGITNLKFKPAYNPYTEPSMEIFGYHPDLGKWTEIGNSGLFRPEMLAPMGLPPNVRVIAWGLSLERPTMIKYRIKNIRDLFGHKVKMATTQNAPIARFDGVAGDTPTTSPSPAPAAAVSSVPGGTAVPTEALTVEGTQRSVGRFARPSVPILPPPAPTA